MRAGDSSSSSFSSSSVGYPSSSYTYSSHSGSHRTPSSSAVSAVNFSSPVPPPTPLRPLDLGPPGYQATIVLFERTAHEATVYLGPWEIVNTEPRRIRWQCSYEGEVLEHFLPSNVPTDMFPHTLHARHRPHSDPCEMELYLSFLEPHRIRYVTNDHTIVHDEHIEVKYEFTTTTGSHRFQSELRAQALVDHFDFDVVWSDKDSRTDAFGSVRGIGAIQRMKMWRDQYSTCHHLTFHANRTDRRYREYLVYAFASDVKHRDDSHRRLRLVVRGRRGSAPERAGPAGGGGGHAGRRFSMTSLRQRPRTGQSHERQQGSSHPSVPRSTSDHNAMPSPLSSAAFDSPANELDIRYLGIQFSRPDDYYRFIEQWTIAQAADGAFGGVPFPTDRFELPSPEISPGNGRDMYTSASVLELPIMEEPEAYDPRGA